MARLHARFPWLKYGRGGYKTVVKQNEMFIMNLTQGLKDMPRQILNIAAAEALDMAVNEGTKHDSSRAAANWDLELPARPIRHTMAPYSYGEHPAGQRYDAGANKQAVWEYKKMVYGIEMTKTPYGSWMQGKEGQALASSISSSTSQVSLYNPIMGTYARKEGADHSGNTYAYNAFYFDDPELGLLTNKLSSTIIQKIGNGFIPGAISYLNATLRTGHANLSRKASLK